MSLEKITTQQMDAKGVCAAPDVLSGTPAQNKAVFDRMVRELIAPAYNAAVDAINEINQTENGIEAAEALRVSAENLRVAAENARAQAEGGRVTAEQARASAENLRVEAENLRKAAETARSKAESGRVTADKDRESAETTRVVNENQRIENENARIAAEHARADENTGIVAQATKKADEAAESARLAAQAMLGQIPDGSFPESKLVSELQEAIDRAKPGGEIDRTSAKKANENLLDNWYFGNPVDQRQGRVVKPNTTYYSNNQLTTSAGTTSAYVTAYRYATGTASGVNYASFKLTDTDDAPTYYAAPENVVRGYVGNDDYGPDRWKVREDTTLTFTDEGFCANISGVNNWWSFDEIVENAQQYAGKTVTFSALVKSHSGVACIGICWADGDGNSQTQSTPISTEGVYSVTMTIPDALTIMTLFMGRINTLDDTEIVISAMKLELGTTQTLAHQDANGNWVLNEIPNYGEQLARCQRYFKIIPFGCMAIAVNANQLDLAVPNVDMRATPVPVVYDNEISIWNTTGMTFTLDVNNPTVNYLTGNGGVLILKGVYSTTPDYGTCFRYNSKCIALSADL